MLAEQLSRFAVEQRINNGYTGRRAGTARLKEQRGFRSSLLHNSLISCDRKSRGFAIIGPRRSFTDCVIIARLLRLLASRIARRRREARAAG